MAEFLHEIVSRRTTITTTRFVPPREQVELWNPQTARLVAQWEEEWINSLLPPPGNEPF